MIIYKYTNIHNGKPYIGQTIGTPEERAGGPNLKHYKGSKKFYNAILKYTADGSKISDHFTFEILEDNINEIEEVNMLERYWIAECDAIKNGYNILPGGQIDNSDMFRKVLEIDVNKNIIGEYKSAAHANRQLFPERGWWHAAEITKCCKKTRSNAGGKYFCFKDEYADYQLSHSYSSFNVVLQLDINKNILNKFNTLTEAARHVGGAAISIYECCIGQYKTSKGYYWCFELDYESFTPEMPGNWPTSNKVAQIDRQTGSILTIFESANKASKATGISRGNISTCCRGQIKSAGGYLWKFVD